MREAGVRLPETKAMRALNAAVDGYRCPALVDQRCSVYEARPMICRLDAASEVLPCHHGCEPDEGPLSAEQTIRLMIEAMAAGGHPTVTAGWREDMLAALADPELREQLVQALTEHNRTVGRAGGPWARVKIEGGRL